MHPISVSLFGSTRVTDHEEKLIRFKTRKAEALFFYLLLESDQAHKRPKLADLFWPDQPEKSGRNNLRQTLHRLRQAFPKKGKKETGLLELEGDTVQIKLARQHHAIKVDALSFKRLIAKVEAHKHGDKQLCGECIEALKRAVHLYTGELLGQFDDAGSSRFEAWQTAQQSWFYQQTVKALEQIISFYSIEAESENRIRPYVEQLLQLEPCHEAMVFQLLSIYEKQGHVDLARNCFEQYRVNIGEVLGVEPSAEVSTLYDKICRQPRPTLLLNLRQAYPTDKLQSVQPEHIISEPEIAIREVTLLHQTTLALTSRCSEIVQQQAARLHTPDQLEALALMEQHWPYIEMGWGLAAEVGHLPFFISCANGILEFCDMTERFSEGFKLFDNALHLVPQIGSFPQDRADHLLLSGRGWLHYRLNNLQAALDDLTQALEKSSRAKLQVSEQIRLKTAMVYQAVGDFSAAEKLLASNRSQSPDLESESQNLLVLSQISLIKSQLWFEDPAIAETHIDQAITLKTVLGDLWGMGEGYLQKGKMAQRRGNKTLAKQKLTEAINIWLTFDNHARAIDGILSLAQLLVEQGDFEKAADWLLQAQLIAEKNKGRYSDQLQMIYRDSGKLQRRWGNIGAAISAYQMGLSLALSRQVYAEVYPIVLEIGHLLDESKLQAAPLDQPLLKINKKEPSGRLLGQIQEIFDSGRPWREEIESLTAVFSR